MDPPDSPSPGAPAFTPVPLRARADGWTPDRQARFIAALALHRSVDRAAREVGMTRATAYRLRRRPGAESFAAAWDAALARPISACPPETADLWRRAVDGVTTSIVYRGRVVGETRRFDDAALIKLYRRFHRLSASEFS